MFQLLTFTLPIVVLAASTAAQPGPVPIWIIQDGTIWHDAWEAVASDGEDGAYVAGRADSFAEADAYVSRFDSFGDHLWTVEFVTDRGDRARDVLADGSGGVYVVGHTGGSLAAPTAGGSDAWLGRYADDGQEQWIIQWGTTASEFATSLAADGEGGIFVGGYFDSTASDYDGFVSRFDGTGALLWSATFASSERDIVLAATSDGEGGVFVAGSTEGNLGGPLAGQTDAFVARFSRTGEQLWIAQFGTSSNDSASAIASDEMGGVYAAGYTRGKLGSQMFNFGDAYVLRLSPDGDVLWTTQFGTTEDDWAEAVVRADGGAVIVGGRTDGDFAGSLGGPDVFLAKFDESGVLEWRAQLGTTAEEDAHGMCVANSGDIYFTGVTQGALGGPHVRWDDAFLARVPAEVRCVADCDGDGSTTFFDFLCFQTSFSAGDIAAECDGDRKLTFFDFLCFQNAFAAGCP